MIQVRQQRNIVAKHLKEGSSLCDGKMLADENVDDWAEDGFHRTTVVHEDDSIDDYREFGDMDEEFCDDQCAGDSYPMRDPYSVSPYSYLPQSIPTNPGTYSTDH
eukprot:GHVR01116587.1.p1 GENE.GHVR01116587.1~~GHVR01116587.1.p1  ORF type:complete len:105 (-),score=10.42 GHVR01116587.1:138-452(-)